MTATVTIRLGEALHKRLSRLSKSTGRTRSDLIREALERQLAPVEFETTRSRTMLFAERSGFLTDDDVFRVAS